MGTRILPRTMSSAFGRKSLVGPIVDSTWAEIAWDSFELCASQTPLKQPPIVPSLFIIGFILAYNVQNSLLLLWSMLPVAVRFAIVLKTFCHLLTCAAPRAL